MKNYTRNLMFGDNEIIVTPKTAADVYSYPSAHELCNAYDLVYGSTERPFPYISKYLCELVVDFLNRNKKISAIGLGIEPVYTYRSCECYTFITHHQYARSSGKKPNCDIICDGNENTRYFQIQEHIIPMFKFCQDEAQKRKIEISAKNREIRDKNAAIDRRGRSFAIARMFSPNKKPYISEADDEYIKILSEVNDLHEKLTNEVELIQKKQARFENKQAWIKKHYGQAFLIIQNGSEYSIFFEKECKFNICKAKNIIRNNVVALQAEQQRAGNSFNNGEKTVEYALKWFFAGCSNRIVAIKNNCSSAYRDNCILLSNSEFIDEPQEYDHILVGSFGVAIIETKHWKGKIEIKADGKWLRYRDDASEPEGVTNPKTQMKRHENLLQSILPNIQIYSILCLSNDSAVIEGVSNFKEYSLVRLDQLGELLTKLVESNTYSDDKIDEFVQQIEKHKISITEAAQDDFSNTYNIELAEETAANNTDSKDENSFQTITGDNITDENKEDEQENREKSLAPQESKSSAKKGRVGKYYGVTPADAIRFAWMDAKFASRKKLKKK